MTRSAILDWQFNRTKAPFGAFSCLGQQFLVKTDGRGSMDTAINLNILKPPQDAGFRALSSVPFYRQRTWKGQVIPLRFFLELEQNMRL
jgi:hypothetical protein